MRKRTFDYLCRDKVVPCPAGDRYRDTHMLVKNGDNLSLRKTGRVDTVELIKSHMDGVSLSKMIERFKRGDSAALSCRTGFYADVSGYVDDPQMVINHVRDAVQTAAADQAVAADQTAAAADQTAAAADQTAAAADQTAAAANQTAAAATITVGGADNA